MTKVIIGSDHGGYALKEFVKKVLTAMDYEVIDAGPEAPESCDYPVYAFKVAEQVDDDTPGILVCGTGLGMSMAANKVKGIRAAVCTNEYMARMSRAHNNANILCLGERVTGPGLAEDIVKTFMTTEFEGDRHLRRISLFDK